MQLLKHVAVSKRQRAILSRSANEVCFARTVIEALLSGETYVFTVEHELHSRGFESRRPLVLDLAPCPFLLYGLSCSVSLRPSQDGQLLFFHLGPDLTWNGARLSYQLRWSPTRHTEPIDAAPCLRFPSMLPEPIGVSWSEVASAAFPQSAIQFVPDELAGDLLASGVRDRQGAVNAGPAVYLDLIIGRGAAPVAPLAGQSVLGSVRASDAVTTLLGERAAAQLSAACAASSGFLQGYLGGQPELDITVCLSEDLPDVRHGGGPLLLFQRSDFERYPLGSFGFGVELTRELASIWWGSGCRLLGKYSKEVTSAIGGALSLHWANTKDTDGFAKTIRAYEVQARGSALQDRWLGASGRGRPKLTAELALALYRGLSGRRGRDALRALTADFWGLYLPVPVFQRELSLAGFDFPTLF